MKPLDELGIRIGLEIHQQLATNKKLFCGCTPIESDEHPIRFRRRLRGARSELGEQDQAALFEGAKSRSITYLANPESSCLVEQDEEPPHNLDEDAKETALIVASALNSEIFDEIYPMRKTVVDGSNTTGFQRTMLISHGGHYLADGKRIGIQSICLEEDAAKILGDDGAERMYGLERLGIPLVEIATEPFEVRPGQVKRVALALGRILRSTKRVRRGLGSIRQDVNISIREGGAVVEVKGVQQLDQLEGIVEYEARRQHGLLAISGEIRSRGWTHDRDRDRADVTGMLSGCGSKIVQASIRKDHAILAMAFRGMRGVFGFSPYEGIRLGRDLAELVRFFGIGGVFHSDELPNHGIGTTEIEGITGALKADDADAFMILAAPRERIGIIADQIVSRVEHISGSGVPDDTRLATRTGETRFLRPRPGAARMYPETDIPPVIISDADMRNARDMVPESWDESVRSMQARHGINRQLSEQLLDSRYAELFEEVVNDTSTSPTFVASTLCYTITNLERSDLNPALLKDAEVRKAFEFLDSGRIVKESIEMIFQNIMEGRAGSVEEAMKNMSIGAVSESGLEEIIQGAIRDNAQMIANQGDRAVGPLMGIVMKELRGRVPGETVNRMLQERIRRMKSRVGAGDGI